MLLSIITIGITKIKTMEKNYSEDEIFPNSPPQPSKSGKWVKTFIALLPAIMIIVGCSSKPDESKSSSPTYHQDDKSSLRRFLSQLSAVSGESNGERIGLTKSDMSSWEDNEKWISKVKGLTWNYDSPKRLAEIVWSGKDLAGKLDLSGNPQLKTLHCENNKLTALDLNGSTRLHDLNCSSNQLTSLNISGHSQLWTLNCNANQLISLDVTGCTQLETLTCANNKLTSLNLMDNLQLKNINYAGNPLTDNSYHLRDKLSLRRFLSQPSARSGKTNGESLGLTKSDMSSWETDEEWVSKVEGLTWNTSSPKRITGIKWHILSDNRYLSGKLDLSGCTALKTLDCFGNHHLTTLNVTGCTQLKDLNCCFDQLTTLNITGCTQLEKLDCSYNKLTTLNVTGCTQLKELACKSNELTTLDITGCTQLKELDCRSNKLTTLDVTRCTQLEFLNCWGNKLTTLDVTGCTQLKKLDCEYNELTSLNITSCTQLEKLACDNNQLTSLDITGCSKLQYLSCEENPLTNYRASDSTSPDIIRSLASAYSAHASKPPLIAYMDLYNYSKDNELAFDSRYKDRSLQVSGVVYSIEKDIRDEYFIRVGNVFGDFVRFYFTSGNIHNLSEIKKGDEILVEGICTGRGYSSNYVRLEQCRLLRSR
jgi:Leucine-rich repeat (LRR) protein